MRHGVLDNWHNVTEAHIALIHCPFEQCPYPSSDFPPRENRLLNNVVIAWPRWFSIQVGTYLLLCVSIYEHMPEDEQRKILGDEWQKLADLYRSMKDRKRVDLKDDKALTAEALYAALYADFVSSLVAVRSFHTCALNNMRDPANGCGLLRLASLADHRDIDMSNIAEVVHQEALKEFKESVENEWALRICDDLYREMKRVPSPAVVFSGSAEATTDTMSYARRRLADALAQRGLHLLRWDGDATMKDMCEGKAVAFPRSWSMDVSSNILNSRPPVKLVVTWFLPDKDDSGGKQDGAKRARR